MSHVDIRFADKNSERYMLARRIYKIIEDLENEYLYPDSETLGGFKFRDGQYKFSQIDEGEWTDFDSENDYWGYREDYAWFRHSFTVPERFAGRPVVYQLTPSASGPWNRSNPQFIMYFNGELRQGGDSNHSEIRLLDCAKGGEEFDCCLNAYSDAWEFKGKLRMGARLKVVDDLVNRLIFDLRTPLKVASLYNADDLPRIDIVKALNDAVNLIDFNTSDYDTFAASAEAAIDLLDREIYSKDAMDATACCIGHTHIDVAWLWRLRQTREKAGRSFATVLKLMEEYPEYKFMSSQAQLYAFVKEDYPEVYEGIKKMIAAGRWEVEGGKYLIRVGTSSDDICLTGEVTVPGTGAPNPYQSVELPHYRTGEVTQVSDGEFAALLGRPIPEDKIKIDRNMTLGELGHGRSPLGWIVAAVLGQLLRQSIQRGKPDLNILFQYNMPLRALAKMTNGAISMGMVDGIVMEAQGFWIIGLLRVIVEAVKNIVLNAQMENRLKNS